MIVRLKGLQGTPNPKNYNIKKRERIDYERALRRKAEDILQNPKYANLQGIGNQWKRCFALEELIQVAILCDSKDHTPGLRLREVISVSSHNTEQCAS